MGSPSESARKLLETPLNATHRRLSARMVDFAGWDMPVQYPTGILAEHAAVRSVCGLFDLSHMGRVFLRGRDAMTLAQECCTRDLARLPAGAAAYSVVCDREGGILDDVIVYCLSEHELMIVFNAANRVSDTQWFAEQRDCVGWNVDLVDRTFDTALIGVQGPSAQSVLQPLCPSAVLDALPGYAFVTTEVLGSAALVSRTGYTGEDGFEVMVDANAADQVWTRLSEAAQPCGLGARDTLRTEAGFALYGHDIARSTNPYEARLGWVVGLSKPAFIGRDALSRIKTNGPRRRLIGLDVAPGGVPRPGLPILEGNRRVGTVTSGTFSPTLRRNIALGYVPVGLSHTPQMLQVEVRGKPAAAEVVGLPFVPHRSRPRATM
ncbi:MAG: glycine cleavage system aminomethyltransferase GcvT [Chloroflexi bacterium]|nr:glycine cleavage system aminomethyltransferase GcvT [Chloroflexota bacterium]